MTHIFSHLSTCSSESKELAFMLVVCRNSFFFFFLGVCELFFLLAGGRPPGVGGGVGEMG